MIACSTSIRCNSPLDAALAEVAQLRFANVDVLTIGTWAHVNINHLADDTEPTVARVESLLAQHRLKPVAMNTGTSVQLHDRSDAAKERRGREIDALIAMMKRLGVTVAAIQPLQRAKDRDPIDALRDAAETVREQVAQGAKAGVRFALELHVHSPFETMDEARRLIEIYPDVPLVYDPTHYVMQGVPLRETEWLMDRAIHAHVRDAAKGKIQTPLGEGEVDFDWMLRALKDRGYGGGFSIEYLETKDFDASASARKLADLVARHFPE